LKASESIYCRCLYFSANAFARKVEKLAVESWKPVGLAPSHAYLLMLVIDHPGIQPSALCEQLLLQPSTITRLVEKLEKQKLLVRVNEGKTTSIYATAKGNKLQPELKSCLKHFYETYSAILGKEESARMVRDMNTLTDKL